MRVSTIQQQAMLLRDVQNINQRQLEGWNQVATGKQITQPAQAPGTWTQLQSVQREVNQLDQYLNTIDSLMAQFQQEDTTLQSYSSYLQEIRGLVLQANNPALSNVDRTTIGEQVFQWRNAIIGLLNSRDAQGFYLFSGSQTSTPAVTITTGGSTTVPGSGAADNSTTNSTTSSTTSSETSSETTSSETMVFNHNNDIRQITVASDITMSSTDNAETLCFTINDGGAGFNLITVLGQLQQTLTENPDTIATLLAGYLVQIDQTQNQVGEIHANLGTRMKALDGIRSDHQQIKLYFQEQAGQLGDLDYASALSGLSLQKVQLSAALKGLAEVENLSLFNYL